MLAVNGSGSAVCCNVNLLCQNYKLNKCDFNVKSKITKICNGMSEEDQQIASLAMSY